MVNPLIGASPVRPWVRPEAGRGPRSPRCVPPSPSLRDGTHRGRTIEVGPTGASQGPISPDCAAGKCPCTGDAWDDDRDRLVPCCHHCHTDDQGERA